ncbi:hypothetical protein HJG60_008535 [Phyllostomus discolor]|uniref:Uncharacterized protein n=1 Tax=Phyllostomus discolor TaxID=89673 RepID=A0A833Z4V6_9CHIR|nr:hypothetical protein HJG60_008535 [Phyllostomus discolor]
MNTARKVSVCLAPVIASFHRTPVAVPFAPSALTPWKCPSLQLRDGEVSNSIKWHKMSMIIVDHPKNASSQPIRHICIEYLLSRSNLLHDQLEQDRWPPSGTLVSTGDARPTGALCYQLLTAEPATCFSLVR